MTPDRSNCAATAKRQRKDAAPPVMMDTLGAGALRPRAPAPSPQRQWTAEEIMASQAWDRARELANGADACELVLAMAAEFKPRNGREHLMLHEVAAAHTTAMKLFGRVSSWAQRAEVEFRLGNTPQAQAANIEAARLANSASRLMSAVTDAALTLERMRTGGRQSITVKHLSVEPGGQALIANRVNGGRRRRGTAGGAGQK